MQLPTPYPTAIYIRERALVVNLQSVRVIITAEFAYIISVPSDEHPDGAVAPRPDSAFVKELMQSVSKSTSSFRGCALMLAWLLRSLGYFDLHELATHCAIHVDCYVLEAKFRIQL